ncbi:hypothetical protein EVJ58_g3170 [Rhodofomes roseus]|uniref:Uncharacterized protein n=1 Tax=Rhodofomes roseus TaxID=34475 RepID=A0A4Y9YP01_9APHY|nr:hypothetical protein EVJ58_g3170 [Rhodofomes roseus]
MLQRPPEPHEWTRFLHYAERVRAIGPSLTFPEFPCVIKAFPSAHSYLLTHKPVDHLFPNLRYILWHYDHLFPEGSMDELSLLLGPRVVDLTTYAFKGMPESLSDRLVDEVTSFIVEHTDIKHVRLYCPYVPGLEAVIPNVVFLHQAVQSLEVLQETPSTLPPNIWLELSRLPKLEKTIIFVDELLGSDEIRKQSAHSSEPFFPSLRNVTIHASDLAGCSRYLDLIQSSSLERLVVIVTSSPTNEEARTFFQHLAKRRHKMPLRFMHFTSVIGSPRFDDNYIIDADTLRPLLSFWNVKSCQVTFRCPVSVDNAFLEDVATAWAPTLEQLELGASWRQRVDSQATLQGVFSLITRCRELASLGLVFDARVDEFQEALGAGERLAKGYRPSDRLTRFSTGATTLGELDETDLATLADVLSDLFPGMRTFETLWIRRVQHEPFQIDEDPDDEGEADCWRQLMALYKEMSTIRLQERLWKIQLDTQVRVREVETLQASPSLVAF